MPYDDNDPAWEPEAIFELTNTFPVELYWARLNDDRREPGKVIIGTFLKRTGQMIARAPVALEAWTGVLRYGEPFKEGALLHYQGWELRDGTLVANLGALVPIRAIPIEALEALRMPGEEWRGGTTDEARQQIEQARAANMPVVLFLGRVLRPRAKRLFPGDPMREATSHFKAIMDGEAKAR
jgi:hypothetical protein